MKLIIDNREPTEIKTIIKSKISNVEIENLDIRDLKIIDDNHNILIILSKKL